MSSRSATSPTPLLYEIRGFDVGDDGFDINIRMNGVRFIITVSNKCFVKSPNAYQRFKHIFHLIESDMDHDADVWDYSQEIADLFLLDFQRLAPKTVHTDKLTLADLEVRRFFECEFKVLKERPIAEAVKPWGLESEPSHDEEWNMRTYQSTFPLFALEDVQVPYTHGATIHDIIPERFFVDGKTYFYKSCYSPWDALDEVTKYCKITKSGLPISELLTSRLSGIVTYHNGLARGLLYEWIETKDPKTLTWAIEENVSRSQKNKWVLQIRDTVKRLHSLGVIWGDVKADNILIDIDKNAVVIDFEGGTTRGWVDRELEGTIEGDQQGLKRLIDFILNDKSPLRVRNQVGDTSDEEE